MKYFADHNDPGFYIEELYGKFGISKVKLEYHLYILCIYKYISTYISDLRADLYKLSQKGRQYLVENDLIT